MDETMAQAHGLPEREMTEPVHDTRALAHGMREQARDTPAPGASAAAAAHSSC